MIFQIYSKRRIVLAIAITSIAVAMGMGSTGVVGAQENPAGNGATWGENQQNETANSEQNTTYVAEIDQNLRVVDWRYDSEDDMIHIEFEAGRSKTITVTEARQFEEGTNKGNIKQKRIPRGTSEVQLAVHETAGKVGVSITTQASIENGEYTVLSTGITDSETPFHQTDSPAGWFGGAATTLSMVGAAAYKVRNEEHDDVEGVE